jgi:hypothetical protein
MTMPYNTSIVRNEDESLERTFWEWVVALLAVVGLPIGAMMVLGPLPGQRHLPPVAAAPPPPPPIAPPPAKRPVPPPEPVVFKRLVSADRVKLLEPPQFKLLPRPVTTLLLTADGRALASVCPRQTKETKALAAVVQLYDVARRTPFSLPQPRQELAGCIAVDANGDGVALGGKDGTRGLLRLWYPHSAEVWLFTDRLPAPVTAVALSSNGQLLACGSEDGTITLWRVSDGKEMWRVAGRGGAVHALAFAPSGSFLAVGDTDNGITLWDTAAGKERGNVRAEGGAVGYLIFSADGTTLASLAGSAPWRVAQVWEVPPGDGPPRLKGRFGRACSLALTPDGRTLATGVAQVWYPSQEPQERPAPASGLAGYAPRMSLPIPTHRLVIQRWDVATQKAGPSFEQNYGMWGAPEHHCMLFSRDGQVLTWASDDRTVATWR